MRHTAGLGIVADLHKSTVVSGGAGENGIKSTAYFLHEKKVSIFPPPPTRATHLNVSKTPSRNKK